MIWFCSNFHYRETSRCILLITFISCVLQPVAVFVSPCIKTMLSCNASSFASLNDSRDIFFFVIMTRCTKSCEFWACSISITQNITGTYAWPGERYVFYNDFHYLVAVIVKEGQTHGWNFKIRLTAQHWVGSNVWVFIFCFSFLFIKILRCFWQNVDQSVSRLAKRLVWKWTTLIHFCCSFRMSVQLPPC